MVWYYLHIGFFIASSKNLYRICSFLYYTFYIPQRIVRYSGRNRTPQITEIDNDYFSAINNVVGRVGTRARNSRQLRSIQQ
jgi:hypothetical protein